jgi:3-oxoacyl-[acyl-carrier-protein] synthase-3
VLGFLDKNDSKLSDFNKIYFQQANISLLHSIVERLGLNKENIPLNFQKYGDVSGTSIPLLLIEERDTLSSESTRILACAYGEGFSWGIADFYLDKGTILNLVETDAYFKEGSVSHEI